MTDMKKSKQHVLCIAGTRPELVKLAPVVREMRNRTDEFRVTLCSTGQHKEMLEQALRFFSIIPDIELQVMQHNQTLGQLTAVLFEKITQVLEHYQPDWVIVQGDTASAMVGAMCAYYQKIKVAHVEAGLRTGNRWSPFPEEINRTVIGHLADAHFAPTQGAADNLVQLGVSPKNIYVTGNTVVDALLWAVDESDGQFSPGSQLSQIPLKEKVLLVTSHRRESHGDGLKNICIALKQIAAAHTDISIVYPVHLSPAVRQIVFSALEGINTIHIVDPLDYRDMTTLMKRCHLILSDSGGIQEEAPVLKKPILILRDTTERPVVIQCGAGILVGTDTSAIVSAANLLLSDRSEYDKMAGAQNPFGDGNAAIRIADIICNFHTGSSCSA